MTSRALIVGSGGQDGTLLFDLLVAKGYEVIGLTRNVVMSSTGNWTGLGFDITNFRAVSDFIQILQPNEVYFLAAHHHSSQDYCGDEEIITRESIAINHGALVGFLEAIRLCSPKSRLFYAASSHIFGDPAEELQDENTSINPITIYGITKASGLFTCRRYRQIYGIFASAGILYNHESPLRSKSFLSKKITTGVAMIKRGELSKIKIGDLNIRVDWGYAPDYVRAMHQVLNIDTPEDFIISTGVTHSVREFVDLAFKAAGLDYLAHMDIDASMMQRTAYGLAGNPAKLMNKTGWRPTLTFSEMVNKLVNFELGERDEK